MQLSYWEREVLIGSPQAVVVGSGITGLTAALTLKQSRPEMDVLVLERGSPPTGASTRNAGFACVGSASEMSADLEELSENELAALLELRWKGLQRLLKNCGPAHIDFVQHGSHELFENQVELDKALDVLGRLNRITQEVCGQAAFEQSPSPVSGNGFCSLSIVNQLEGSLNPGKVVNTLLKRCADGGVRVLSGMEVTHVDSSRVDVAGTRLNPELILVCTNGFARRLLPTLEVHPARNQVWLTHPIPDLPFEGIFHMNAGYTYFRTVGNRLLIGGFRHLHAEVEATDQFGLTAEIEGHLKGFAENRLLPNHTIEWDMAWSGILGVGPNRMPILKEVKPGLFAGVRLGGMGVAIGSELGHNLALMALKIKAFDNQSVKNS